MLIFHSVCMGDADWAAPLLRQPGREICEYDFPNLFMWGEIYGTCIARFKDSAIARFTEGKTAYSYLYPSGVLSEQDEAAVIGEIVEDAVQNQKRLHLFALTRENVEFLKKHFPDRFTFSCSLDDSDYLYLASDLAELLGKKYQKKRNHVSHFCREYPAWEFHELTAEWLPQIRKFNDLWAGLEENRQDEGIQEEHRAIGRVFDHFEELDIRGGLITVNGKIVAYSYGTPINDQVFDVQVEKALYDVNGAYNIINREMARYIGKEFRFLNREEDMGEEGLREAKQSYHPLRMVEKWVATPAGQE